MDEQPPGLRIKNRLKQEERGQPRNNQAESGTSEERSGKAPERPFEQGDAVWIYPLRRSGIVYRPADERGNVIVQVEGRKLSFNRKRLKPYISREKLYPGSDYDMDIVFDTKQNRKLRKMISRKHVDGVEIILPPEQ